MDDWKYFIGSDTGPDRILMTMVGDERWQVLGFGAAMACAWPRAKADGKEFNRAWIKAALAADLPHEVNLAILLSTLRIKSSAIFGGHHYDARLILHGLEAAEDAINPISVRVGWTPTGEATDRRGTTGSGQALIIGLPDGSRFLVQNLSGPMEPFDFDAWIKAQGEVA